MAQALLEDGNLDRAAAEARRGLGLDRNSGFAVLGQYVLADVLTREGRRAEAAEEVRRGKEAEARGAARPGGPRGRGFCPAAIDSAHGAAQDKCMAVKTITIDLEAYKLLFRHKREGQSFSQVIKEHFSGSKTGRDLEAVLQEIQVSPEALDSIDAQVKRRGASPATAPEW